MAELTVRAYAELIHTPLHGQLRILTEQKYPDEAPGSFKVPYYFPTLTAIRRYFQNGNNQAHLPATGDQLPGLGQNPLQHRIDNNLRAINAFRNGTQRQRPLTLHPQQTWQLPLIETVIIRATPDLIVTEGANNGYILLDCRDQQQENEIIRTTVELLHHTLSQNGVECPIRHVEYIHLCTDTVFRWNTVRQAHDHPCQPDGDRHRGALGIAVVSTGDGSRHPAR